MTPSNRKCTGQRNVKYQRHYLKIARLLEELNNRYRGKVKIYPSFHYHQVTHEALSMCHSVRREPDSEADQPSTPIGECYAMPAVSSSGISCCCG